MKIMEKEKEAEAPSSVYMTDSVNRNSKPSVYLVSAFSLVVFIIICNKFKKMTLLS